MANPVDPADLVRLAAAALTHVADGMVLGLGSGRAAAAFIATLGEAVQDGLRIRGVATSEKSAALARAHGIEVITLEDITHIDVAIDGADEVSPTLDLTKGRGGALVRERVVAHEAKTFIVLVTAEKLVPRLGTRTPIPVEVVPFALSAVLRNLRSENGVPTLRAVAGAAYQTDNGNVIVDTDFGPLADPRGLAATVRQIPGVVDIGLFCGMADLVLCAAAGAVRAHW